MSLDKVQQVGNKLACIARELAELAEKLKADQSSEEVPAVKYPDISKVRGLLAEKSRAGHTAEVQALLAKHGVKKLSEVPETEYAALMEEARTLE